MSRDETMRNGLPRKYWVFRNVVTLTQIVVVVFGLFAGTLWLVSDGHGVRIWENFYRFSQSASDWSHNSLRMPWEAGSDQSFSNSDSEFETDESESAYSLGMCGDQRTPVFEGETNSFYVSICQSADGSLAYVGGNSEQGWIDLPAEDRGGYWAASNGSVTYGVSEQALNVLDNATDEYLVAEDMNVSVVH